MFPTEISKWFIFITCCFEITLALDIDLANAGSIKKACATIAKNVLTFYTGNKPGQTPGILPKPYYWWQAGALWGELIEYWAYTGDSSYNDLVMEALQHQVGVTKKFMPENVTKELGNDDQAFWAFSAMSAAELGFPNPAKGKPSWVALAQAVFNSQVERWDLSYCGGGLRWQIFITNPGYDYKNTISNGAFFQLSARLARYTGNDTYKAWAEKTWDWLASTPNLSESYEVNDGSAIRHNCTDTNHLQWSYNYGTMIMGSAYMYTVTTGDTQQKWKMRVDGLIDKFFERFFPGLPNVIIEISCEPDRKCNPDQTSFKAYTMRWLAVTTQLCPWTTDIVMPKLRESAMGAARQCSGGDSETWCGQSWNATEWDGFQGVGEQMSAMAVIGANLIQKSPKPLTARNGGISEGDPNAGNLIPKYRLYPVSTADRTGAAIITFLSIFIMVLASWWLVYGD